jgi:SAM-dependent methyltransferase
VSGDRFQGWSDQYASFRPTYPAPLMKALADLIVEGPPPTDGVVADVGSGTGIFTRQLRASLPDTIPIFGIEPVSDMRLNAKMRSPSTTGITYLAGTAEKLPLKAQTARAVVAATAAHWFDRPAFFGEAYRTLMSSGLMAIVEYVRDEEGSPAAAAVIEFLSCHGSPRAYAPPDYEAELRSTVGFRDFKSMSENVTLQLTTDAFLGLALSSSHARAAIRTLGKDTAEKLLLTSVDRLVSSDGRIPYGYIFRMFTVRSGV